MILSDAVVCFCRSALKEKPGDPLNIPTNAPLKRLEQIITLISKQQEITIEYLASHCQVSIKTIKRDITKLKKENRIERVGTQKSGYWKIIDEKNGTRNS
ncbi:MAG: DeoR family transcriptional regulator [Proteobacteria bacterium]|nr:DeoR family transcriptional regulator [Pseudomonadota bacterium]